MLPVIIFPIALQIDSPQQQKFFYCLFLNATLSNESLQQMKIFSMFSRKILPFRYQEVQRKQHQQAPARFLVNFQKDEILQFLLENQIKDPRQLFVLEIKPETLTYFQG